MQRTPPNAGNVSAPAHGAERCPLCGELNACALCTGTGSLQSCWCASEAIPDGLLAQIPVELQGHACICRRCVNLFREQSAQRAFTLVELLVTIAIIATLAALLLPTLSRSKDSAHRIRCVANLHQFGLAAQMYWDDHNGECFRYGGTVTNGGQIYWFGWIGNGAEGQRPFDPMPGMLYPYLLGRGVELCPSLNYSISQFKLKATSAAYGYGYNLHLSVPAKQAPFKIGTLRQPSQTGVFADAAQVNTFLPPASRANPLLEEFYYVSTNLNEATAHFRHAQRANVVFADGHVAAERMAAGSLDQNLPAQHVGRLRAEVLTTP